MHCGDIVKDDSGAYAVFTEHGSSASQMAAAKIMDVIARLPGCDGQAADAVSAYTQVKLEDAPRLLKSPKSECPDVWIRVARHKCQNQGTKIEDPVVPLERNFSWSSISRIAVGKTIRRTFIGTWVGENSELGMYVLSSETKVIVLSVYVDDNKIAGRKRNRALMWKKLMKNVNLDEPTSFLDHACLGCTQRECKSNENTIKECT